MTHGYELENGEFQATLRPIETAGRKFVADLTVTDVCDGLEDIALARSVGSTVFDLMQTTDHKELGAPFQAMTISRLPTFTPTELTEFATGGNKEIADSLRLDYGLPAYMLATEDPEGHVHSLFPVDFAHLPEGPQGWHNDLTFMPNRPTRSILQAYRIGSTLRPGSLPYETRTTLAVDGRWMLQQLEDFAAIHKMGIDFDALLTTETFRDSFMVDYEHLLGQRLDQPITHPKVCVSPTGERALIIRSFAKAHYADGRTLDDAQIDLLDEKVNELFSSKELPFYTHYSEVEGQILVISDRTPHRRGRSPHQETELRRVCTHTNATYKPPFSPEDLDEVPPAGYVQPTSINDIKPEDFTRSMELAINGQFGDIGTETVKQHFQGRVHKYLRNMRGMVHDHPDINLDVECSAYARRNGIPGVTSFGDLLQFAGLGHET